METIKCDCCARKVDAKDAYVSWWVDMDNNTKQVFLTCHPSQCQRARALERAPSGLHLMDHHAPVIAARLESWAKDFKVDGETVASVAVRLAALLAAGAK